MWIRILEYLNKEIAVNNNVKDTRFEAKSRLKLVLRQDRNKISPCSMEKMKNEIFEVVSRYVETNKNDFDFYIENNTETMELIANIPVISIKQKAFTTS